MKKFAIGAAVVVGLIVATLAVLPFAIDLNKHKGAILAQVKTYTNRQVDFKEIKLTILTGLGAEIKDLRISDDTAFSKEDFLTLKAAKVKIAIWPLLSREIKINTVVLKEPRIHIVKNAQGVFNFTTLATPKPGQKPKKPKPGAFASLLVSNVVIKQGMITYKDEKLGPDALPFTISDMDLESQDISMFKPVSFSLSASVMSPEGQNFALAGTVGPAPEVGGLAQMPLDVHLILDSLPLTALPVKMPIQAGTMKIDITAKGILKDKIAAKMALDLEGFVMRSADNKQPAKVLKGITCKITNDLILEFDKQQLMISNGTFALGQDRGSFQGAIRDLKTAPAWNVSFKSGRIAPGPILEQLPMFAGLIPAKITLSGPAGFSLTTSGTKESFQVNTDIDMLPMAITFGKVFNKPANSPMTFSSRTTMKPESTQIHVLDLNLGAIMAQGSGEARKASGKSSYQIRIQTRPVSLQAAQAIIPMLQAFKPTGNVVVKTTLSGGTGSPMDINVQAVSERLGLVLTKPKEGEQPRAKVLAGPMKADMNNVTFVVDALKKEKVLTARGSMKSQGGVFMEAPYSTLVSTFALENDQFKVNSFDLNALKGSIKGSASYNLKTKAWAAAPVFNNVQAGSILDMLTNFKGVFTGAISGDLKATGVAGAPALNNLGATGNLTISKGEWKNFDLAGTALSSILGVPGASEIFGFAPAEVQKYNATRFESLNTSIDLAKKVVNINSMKLLNISSGKDVDTESNLKGTISMETNEVHLKGNVVLPKRFSQRMGARAQAFSAIMNDQKRLVLPITITGSVKKPLPMVEVKSLSSAFTRYYANKALDQGLKKLQDKGTLPSGTDGTRKSLDNMMEGLFKKKKK